MKLIIASDDGKEIAKFNIPGAKITLDKPMKSGETSMRTGIDGNKYKYNICLGISAVTDHYEGIDDLTRENDLSDRNGKVEVYSRVSRSVRLGVAK